MRAEEDRTVAPSAAEICPKTYESTLGTFSLAGFLVPEIKYEVNTSFRDGKVLLDNIKYVR